MENLEKTFRHHRRVSFGIKEKINTTNNNETHSHSHPVFSFPQFSPLFKTLTSPFSPLSIPILEFPTQ
ncbi:hypothetical protein RJT34_28637 [Clitoria ternatea]|uniref:Uncharacterized protein n=1 Tax=Clitoria ternatea TaxID=43366 RepID=A0AAN9FDK9_CLITE